MEAKLVVAGIDVHKKMMAVVVVDDGHPQEVVDQRKFGSGAKELLHLSAWLAGHGVDEVVMESTAQYWRPVWLALEREFVPHLAQAQSNAAPRGRKSDFVEARRLARTLV